MRVSFVYKLADMKLVPDNVQMLVLNQDKERTFFGQKANRFDFASTSSNSFPIKEFDRFKELKVAVFIGIQLRGTLVFP